MKKKKTKVQKALSKISKAKKPDLTPEKKIKSAPKNLSARKTLVPKKYKPHLQRAYVISVNSFVYRKPDFDAEKLYSLGSGQKILISKKIFRPPHNFGSFYRVFLFRDKKLVGYISEAEVVPEFLSENKKHVPNPAYKIARKQMAKDKALDVNLIEKTKKPKEKGAEKSSTPKSPKKRYIGLSVGFSGGSTGATIQPKLNPAKANKEEAYVGLKLSGYNLLISYLNLDINLMASVSDFKSFYMDILSTFPVFKSSPYYLFALAGFNVSKNNKHQSPDNIDAGVSGALSFLLPVKPNLLLRLEAKTSYGVRFHSFRYGLSGALQVGF